MIAKMLKWGNSLAVRIPKTLADEMKAGNGSSLIMVMKEGALVIEPIHDEPWSLAALLAGITDSNRHEEWETGYAQGREIW
jgi:antitoxin MazE